jgi:hypothetical protein
MCTINEIQEKYDKFSDGIILEILYKPKVRSRGNHGEIVVIIKCFNIQRAFEFEHVKLIFCRVIYSRLLEQEDGTSTVINAALLYIKQNGNIVIDFFPKIISNSEYLENPDSNFSICCEEVRYEILNG